MGQQLQHDGRTVAADLRGHGGSDPGVALEVRPGGGDHPHLADPARSAERVRAVST